jgi:hypothetical protein
MGDERSHRMTIIRKARLVIGLMVLGGAVLPGTPTFAVEPEVGTPAGAELPALRKDRVPGPEATDSVFAADVVINEPATPLED